MKKILFIIGSLRKESFNRQLAAIAEKMIDGRATVEYLDYSNLPMMNQDVEFPAPEAVSSVRKKLKRPTVFGFSLLSTTTAIPAI